ncbi:hypothetical protein D9M73_91810 [compost metagenome]
MRNPAPRAVHRPRGPCAGYGQILDHPHQRLDTEAEPARIGCPIIHLSVDVDGVFAAPRRGRPLIPDALQRRRLAARSRRGDEQIAAILQIQRRQRGIDRGRARRNARVGWQRRRRAGAQIDLHPAEQRRMIRHMRPSQRGVALSFGRPTSGTHRANRIAAGIAIAAIAGRGGDQHGHAARAGHGYALLVRDDGAVPHRLHAQRVAQPCRHAERGFVRSGHQQGMRAIGSDRHVRSGPLRILALHPLGRPRGLGCRPLGELRARRTDRTRSAVGEIEVERATFRFQPHHDHLIGGRCKHLTPVTAVRGFELGCGDARCEVELAPIDGRDVRGGEGQQQIAERAIRHLRRRFPHHLC